MKHRIKLLKAWRDATGVEFKAGDVVELEDADVVKTLLFDGTGERVIEDKQTTAPQIDQKAIADAVQNAIKDHLPKMAVEKTVHVSIHDKSDDDPTGGYLPERSGDKFTKDEKMFGFGQFCKDVADAGRNSGRIPERLMKAMKRSADMIVKAVKAGLIAEEKAAGDGMNTVVSSEGGFLIATEFSTMLLESSVETAVVRPLATTMQIGSNRIELPQINNYDHSSNLIYGGLLAYWKGEEAQLTEKKMKFEQIGLNLHKLTILAYASDELIRFSPISVSTWLLPRMADAIAWKEDDGFINGDGIGQPLGLINAPGKENVAVETGQTLANGTIVTENIDKMWARLRLRSLASTRWFYNKTDLFPSLAALKRTVGTGGNNVGLLTQIAGSPQMSMYGIPLAATGHCQAAGTVGDIILSDLSQYIVVDDRQGPDVAQSMHLKFDYAQMAYRILKYTDGQPQWTQRFKGQKSTNYNSSIVTLATRS